MVDTSWFGAWRRNLDPLQPPLILLQNCYGAAFSFFYQYVEWVGVTIGQDKTTELLGWRWNQI